MPRPLSITAFKKLVVPGAMVRIDHYMMPFLSRETKVIAANSSSFTTVLDDPRDGKRKPSKMAWPKAAFSSPLDPSNVPHGMVGMEFLSSEDRPIIQLVEGKQVHTGRSILAGTPWITVLVHTTEEE